MRILTYLFKSELLVTDWVGFLAQTRKVRAHERGVGLEDLKRQLCSCSYRSRACFNFNSPLHNVEYFYQWSFLTDALLKVGHKGRW